MNGRRDESTHRELEVDGETFTLTVRGTEYQFTWLTGPNPGYGFGGTLAGTGTAEERSAKLAEFMTDEVATADIRSFLAEIDPATGYLRD
ncbi:hypothetical protein ACIQUC_09160 [Curtobacterium sp. NPDC098951]|jgi:hypothetical protein|uniref:hypothetical protein n=1 Tax=unclassified Curtobacterium TaxID=257496 RepID=UPI00382F9E93